MVSDFLVHLDSIGGLLALAFIAFGDTLIGVGFFVFGEIAFLAAGAAFASNGATHPALIVLIAAWAGDLTSFYLGRRMGPRASLPLLKTHKRRLAWRRAKKALEQRGVMFVVISRLLGPVAWITPFLAGTLSMPAPRFVFAAAFGVLLGVGQFLIIGAVGQQAFVVLKPFANWLMPTLAAGLIVGAAALIAWQKRTRTP